LGGNNKRFGVSAIQEKQIVAKVFLIVLTIETFAARGGVGDDNALAEAPVRGLRL